MKTTAILLLAPTALAALVATVGSRLWNRPLDPPNLPTPSWRHPSPIYHRIIPPPTQTPEEIERGRRFWNGVRAARRLSESGSAPEALRTLRELSRDMASSQRDAAILNNRVWYDVLLRNGEYGTILAAYRARGGEPHLGVNAAVTIADIESNGRVTVPPEVGRASVSRFLARRLMGDVPEDGTVQGRLALAYLSIGQDYQSETYFKAAQWYYERAMRLLPGDPFCAYCLGENLNEQGQNAAALAVFAKARPARTPGLRHEIEVEARIARGYLDAKGRPGATPRTAPP